MIKKFFEGNAWLNVVFFLLAIIGIILSIYFYYKSKREKKPVFSKKTFPLVMPYLTSLKNLDIKYKDQKVDKLSLTKFAFWNAGREPIKSEDITANDPLLIVTSNNVFIYDFEIIFQNKSNNCQVEILTNSSLSLRFDFLNYKDGVVLNIYHNGTNSSALNITGTLIGSEKLTFGLHKDVVFDKIDFIFDPINKWPGSSNYFVKISGWLLLLPMMIASLALIIIIMPLNFFYNRLDKKYPKEFYLTDDL